MTINYENKPENMRHDAGMDKLANIVAERLLQKILNAPDS